MNPVKDVPWSSSEDRIRSRIVAGAFPNRRMADVASKMHKKRSADGWEE